MWFKSYLFVHKTHLDRMNKDGGGRRKLRFNSVASNFDKISLDKTTQTPPVGTQAGAKSWCDAGC